MDEPRGGRPGPFPTRDNAFVVHLTHVGETPSERASGRVEHVRSGRSALFSSAEELMRFMWETLAEIEAESR